LAVVFDAATVVAQARALGGLWPAGHTYNASSPGGVMEQYALRMYEALLRSDADDGRFLARPLLRPHVASQVRLGDASAPAPAAPAAPAHPP